MCPFWFQCVLVSALLILYHPEQCEGLTIKIKLKDVLLKITLVGKKTKNTTETNINLPYTDKEQWTKLRSNMFGNSSEANLNNATSLFDRIVITNAFARSASKDGRFLYQGDILMDANSFIPDKRMRKKRAIIAFEYFRWNVEQGVPYKLHSSLDDASRRVILSAMREWEESLPCIKWRVKTADDVDFVHFFKGDGCFSQVGRTGSEQSLSIGRGCAVHGIVLHEMGHALGIFHEQSRPDRDNYVKIVKENILEGFEPQFEKFSEEVINSYNISYDYSSIMHYSATAFAKQKGLVTMEPRPKHDVKFGQRVHLSHGDIRQARAMYGCEDTEFIATPGSTTPSKPTTTRKPTTSKATTTPKPPTSKPTTAPKPTTNEEISSGTSPDDITKPTTLKKQTDAVTLQATTQQTESLITSTPKTNKPTIATGVVETQELKTDAGAVATTEPVTILTPSKPEKPEVCVDLLSTCYKWIRKGYCSPSSPNYWYMKYFCSRTCQIWRNSELSMGATCVDLFPDCEVKALVGQCTDLDNREYMENMCCESCHQANCIDEDPFCEDWAASGACAGFSYLQRHCKKSCNLCDI